MKCIGLDCVPIADFFFLTVKCKVLQVHFVPENSVKFGVAPVDAIGVFPHLPSGGALSITFRMQIPPVSDYFSKPTAFI